MVARSSRRRGSGGGSEAGGRVRQGAGLLALVSLALALALSLGTVRQRAAVVPGGGSGPAGVVAANHVGTVSVNAHSAISTGFGSNESAIAMRPSRTGYTFSGGGVAARLGPRSISFRSGGVSFSLAFAGVGRSARLTRPRVASVRARGNQVLLDRGSVREWYAAEASGIEQGFTLVRRPPGAGRAVSVALAVAGSMRARQSGSEVSLLTPSGRIAFRYGDLSAVDADGRPLQTALESSDGRVFLRVWDRGARYPLRIDPMVQQGAKITAPGEIEPRYFGDSVSVSADGGTALIGGNADNGGVGAAWVFTRSGSTWVQQGPKLTANDETGSGAFGGRVALSPDGDTAVIGGTSDNSSVGAAWVFTRSGSTWTQQGPKLTANDQTGKAMFGNAVALSSDGNTALIGGYRDAANVGAAWVFTRSGSTWTQQGPKLTANDEIGAGWFGISSAISADGNTALIGGDLDNSNVGGAWVFTRSGSTWARQGPKLTASDETGKALFGSGVGLSSDGNTALIGGVEDNGKAGAAWTFTRSGSTWTQDGPKLTPTDETGAGLFGGRVAISADGTTALIGGDQDNSGVGAAWVFTHSGSVWAQKHAKLTAFDETGPARFGLTVALSADGTTAVIGGQSDNGNAGAAWVFLSPRMSSPPNLSFGPQPIGQGGPVLWVPVQNTGPAILAFNGAAQITGSNAGDFAIPSGDELCNGQTLTPGQSCWIGVQFTPSAIGPRTAILSFGANMTDPPKATVALVGIGVASSSGTTGPQGPTGAAGATGPQGVPGATGPTGKGGQIMLVTCKPVTQTVIRKVHGRRTKVKVTKQRCSTKTVSGPVTFTTSGTHATLSRGHVVYAVGGAVSGSRPAQVRLAATRELHPGQYTLTLTWSDRHHHHHTSRQPAAVR